MKFSVRNVITIAFLFIISNAAFSQKEEENYKDTISITEWLVGMSDLSGNYYELRNTLIRFEEKGIDSSLFREVLGSRNIGGRVYGNLEKRFNYSHLKLNSDLNGSMINCKFSGSFEFVDLSIGDLVFQDCIFSNSGIGGFTIRESKINNLFFFNCKGYSISVIESEIANGITFSGSKIRVIEVTNNTFTGYSFVGYRESIMISYGDYKSVVIDGCSFNLSDSVTQDSTEKYVSIGFLNAKIESLVLTNMDVFSIDLNEASVSKSILFENLEIESFIRAKSFDIPKSNTNLNWSIIGGNKLCFETNDTLSENYFGDRRKQIANVTQFTELLSIYQKMLNLYKERGDRQSFNACYVEMRDLQTDRLHYEYTQNKTINTLFNWRMNQFLKTFCDFGTNPVKPLIISMWVILAFGFMYFFFYNEWDKVNRQFLIKQHRKMLQYFSSEQKLEDFYTDEYMADFKSYESYKQEIDETNLHVPFFIRVLGKPLYKMSLVRFQIMTWLYRSTEVLQGKWSDLTKGRKVFVGATVGSGILIYLVFLVAIRLLNSVVLSINTFSTLGFGDIPVKGIMKYMAILEGFLGWFLLSIFSVSLISQILPA